MSIVEQCLEKIYNPFLLVAIASQRAHTLSLDANLSAIDQKKAVISLADIAEGKIDVKKTYDDLVNSFRKLRFLEEKVVLAQEEGSSS